MKTPFYKTGSSKSPFNVHDGTNDPHIELTPTSSNKKNKLNTTNVKSGTTDFKNVKSRESSNPTVTGRGLLEAASYAPGIGTAAQVAIAGDELNQGNYKNAAMAGLFAIPGAKLLKGAGKLIKSGMKAFSKTKRPKLASIEAIDGTFKPGSVNYDAGKAFKRRNEKVFKELSSMNPGPDDLHMNLRSKIKTRSTKTDPNYGLPLSEVNLKQKIVPPKTNPAFNTKITSKKDPRYYKPDRKFSDRGDGSLRVDPISKKSTVPKETKYTSIDKGPTNRKNYFNSPDKPIKKKT